MKSIFFLFAIVWMCLAGGVAFAGHGHHSNGFDGIKAGSPAAEGFYWRMYNVYYTADQLRDKKGNKVPGDFEMDMFITANTFIWSTPVKLLGGNLIVQAVIPVAYADVGYEIGGYRPEALNDHRFNLADIVVDPFLLRWHGERWEATAGIGVYMPTGGYSASKAASPGKGFWTVRNTLGGTLYLDKKKTWSASILARYEVHTKQRQTRITPGHDFHFDWGVGKSFYNGLFTIGMAGYCSWQVTKDSGTNASNTYERVFGVGPEIGFVLPDWKFLVNLRVVQEFENRNSARGTTAVFVLTKYF
jgi:hypothetical protein